MNILLNQTKKRYIAVFLVKQKNSYEILKQKRFKPTNNIIRFQKKTYVIDVGNETASKGISQYYYIDIATGQLNVKDNKKLKASESLEFDNHGINPEMVDMILSQKIISQLTSNLTNTQLKINIFLASIFSLLGGFIGYVIGISI